VLVIRIGNAEFAADEEMAGRIQVAAPTVSEVAPQARPLKGVRFPLGPRRSPGGSDAAPQAPYFLALGGNMPFNRM
jgi:hypothetical protein